MQDPFASWARNLHWLLALQPNDGAGAVTTSSETTPDPATTSGEAADPKLRITQEEFRKLLAARAVTVVDVRDAGAFSAGHIPGALSIPLGSVEQAAERLRKAGKPVVTYCS
jgi:3-mercaptopyruvate sulfurtransferase SseA